MRTLLLAALLVGCGVNAATAPGTTPEPTDEQCPPELLEVARSEGGVCWDLGVLGRGVVERCGAAVHADGWVRDPVAEEAISGETGLELRCFHAAE